MTAGRGNTFECRKCKQQLPVSAMSKNRPNVCEPDTLSYKSLSDRWRVNRSVKTWWDALSEDQKTHWFLKQQETPSGSRRRFDMVTYEETTQDFGEHVEDEIDGWIPWRYYKLERLLEGKQLADIVREWERDINDPKIEAKQVRGEWLLPVFKGLEARKRKVSVWSTTQNGLQMFRTSSV